MQQLAMGVRIFLLIVVLTMAFPQIILADSPIVLLSPQGPVATGQSLVFRIRTQEIVLPSQAVLNYRPVGSLTFQTLSMNKESAVEFAAILPSEQLLPPGVEYYFAVVDSQGRLFTFPQQNPQQQPIRIDLSLKPEAVVELKLPAMDGARIEARQADLAIPLAETGIPEDWTALRLTVDDVDVSQVAVLDGNIIRYSPEVDFAYGRHRVSLEAMDAAGNMLAPQYWTFTIPMSGLIDSASAQAQFDVEVGGLVMENEDSVEPDWLVQSNITLSSHVESGKFRISLDANGWYAQQDGAEPTGDVFNLNNYLLKFEYGQQGLAIGDLQINGTDLLGKSIARRGGLLDLNYADSHLQAFLLRSNAVIGFANFSGMGDSDQRLFGGSLEQEVLAEKALTIKAMVVTGKNAVPENYNVGTLAAGNDGEVYSVQLTSRMFDERIDLSSEYSVSSFDADIFDAQGHDWDRAWRLQLAGHADGFDYGGGYKHLGQNFHSIVTPTTVANRAEYNLYGTKTYEESSLTANIFHTHDNVDRDPLQPQVNNSTIDLTYNLYKTDWPLFFLNCVLGVQDSSDEPVGLVALQNRTETIGGGFTLTKESWNLVPSYYFTRFEDESLADSDSQTHQLTLSLGMQPHEAVSLSPTFSYSRVDDEAAAVVNETWQGALSGLFTISQTQNLNLTFSGIDSRADDGSMHTTSTDTIGQYNWLFATNFWEEWQKTISIRGRYNRLDDRVGSSSTEDYSVYLFLSISGSPLQLF